MSCWHLSLSLSLSPSFFVSLAPLLVSCCQETQDFGDGAGLCYFFLSVCSVAPCPVRSSVTRPSGVSTRARCAQLGRFCLACRTCGLCIRWPGLGRHRSAQKALPPQLLPRLRRSAALHLQLCLCCPLRLQGITALRLLPPLGPLWQLVSIQSCRPPLRSLSLVRGGGMVGLCHMLIALAFQVRLRVARVRPYSSAFGAPELACLFLALAPAPSRMRLARLLAPPSLPVPGPAPVVEEPSDPAVALHHTTIMRLPCASATPVVSSAAAEETRLLLQRWLDLVKGMGSRSELFVEASASADLSFLVQRVAAKFAPSTLQRYFDSWLNWVSFCRLSGADPLSPVPGLLPDWLRSQSSKNGLSTMQLKSLAWFCKTAGLPTLRHVLLSGASTGLRFRTAPYPGSSPRQRF